MGWFGKTEKVNPFSVYTVLRDLLGHMTSTRDEVRLFRKENAALKLAVGELRMSIDALKANVLTLIGIAEAGATAAAAGNPDQAGIDDLNNQVVSAINILHPVVTAAATAANTAPPPAPTPAPTVVSVTASAPAAAPAAPPPAFTPAPAVAPVPPAVDPNAPAA